MINKNESDKERNKTHPLIGEKVTFKVPNLDGSVGITRHYKPSIARDSNIDQFSRWVFL